MGVFWALPSETREGLPATGTARPGLGQAERVDESVTETSPEQRGSEVHTKKTVMIKTIETRDGEVSGLPGTLTPEVGGAVSQVSSTSRAGSAWGQKGLPCWGGGVPGS